MKRNFIRAAATAFCCCILLSAECAAQNVTVKSQGRDASSVFAEIMHQSGKNFIYSSDILKGVKVKVNAKNEPLEKVLQKMFKGTGITYRIIGNNILLTKALSKRPSRPKVKISDADPRLHDSDSIKVGMLRNIDVIGSKNQTLSMISSQVGALNISRDAIARTPVIFGESDLIKTLQLEPGISSGVEGLAGMYVHGGNVDENMYMLDNIPLYQVNHLGGLFSAFNTEAVKNVDFYKSSFPAKFDGRLSSFLDVYTREGSADRLKGSVKLGLTSGSFQIEGPLGSKKTTFSVAMRRSWLDIITWPACAIINATHKADDEDMIFGYAFTDLNAKITHHFNDRSRLYGVLYYGEDYLRSGTLSHAHSGGFYNKQLAKLKWGNIMASAGWIYDITPDLRARAAVAYSRYHSMVQNRQLYEYYDEDDVKTSFTDNTMRTNNHISDYIVRSDFEWRSSFSNTLSFGAGFTFHHFTPLQNKKTLLTETYNGVMIDNSPDYNAGEWNFYAGDDFSLNDNMSLSAGLHYSLFNITGKTKQGLSPRLSLRYATGNVAIKAAYSRTVQYVHQLSSSAIALPTDQWVPIAGNQKTQTADKTALGIYWKPLNLLTVSVEGYLKWLHNILDYKDEYYLLPANARWDEKLAEGKGFAKGIDFKVSKEFGNLTGHVAYSLLWADRQFANRNGGRKYPARYDNRHKINVMLCWKFNDRWEAAASWTGMSGNRITLPVQMWQDPGLAPWHYDMTLKTEVNNYRLPFYHRLDISFTRHTSRGYWTFGLYNAYCHMNVIGVRLDYSDYDYDIIQTPNGQQTTIKPVFQKIKLLPTIPSVSYTWLF